MTFTYRIRNILLALLMIFFGIIMIVFPEYGAVLTAFVIGLLLLVFGISYLIYYRTMARHMVGGKLILFFGIILLDLGFLLSTMTDEKGYALIFFLQGFFGFYGVVDILRARQSKKSGAPLWKLNLVHGSINLTIVVLAFISSNITNDARMLSYLFAVGMFYSAAMRIYTSFRKTAIIYIP